jgi:TP901 family phage tail tape measure protein
MADVNANIGVNIDTTQALAQLKALQRQISQFHSSIAKSSETATLAQRDLQRNFLNSVNAIGAFSAELRTVRTTAETFTDSLEKNKFSMREYFRYAGASTKTFGKLFKSEFDTIGKVAEDRVKKLQTQYIKLGRDTTGAMKAIAIIPNELDLKNFSTQTQLAAQRQALFNQLVRQGSTNLLNFGKNTQWAGRQLMVGFTLPLATLGTVASRTFMEMEAAALKFRKVYGDLFTPREETQQALADVTALGQMFTKYGVAVKDTVALAAEAAAAGFQGIDLQRQTAQATRLSILGQIDNQKALETTISLQNAFKMSSESLAGSIDFLNAVENQTVVSLDDITTAIPKVAPVIQQLGGDVKDLAFFMAAMKEGGVNASEGANALKSGLAALINPTEKAAALLATAGINIKGIVEANKGDLKGTVIAFAQALDTLDPLNRARAIEQLFGKFQFARLSTLFDNVVNQTGQAARVLDLAGTSIEDLAALSESELGMTADSAMNKFRKSVEDMKMALIPVGQTFLEAVTPIVEFVGGILEKFNNLSSGVKKALVVLTVAIGAIGPVALMTFGLLANGLANIVKGAMILRQGYLRLTGQTQILGEQTDYLTTEQMNAAAVAHSLDQSHARLTQTFNVETGALTRLIQAYQAAARAGAQFAATNPGMMIPPRGRGFNKGTMSVKKYANGVTIVPGSGNKDTVAAMLTPGEAIIPKDKAKQYAPLIAGMIAGNIPGYMAGTVSVGGRQSGLDFARSDTAAKAQRLIDAMLADGAGIENALTIVEETLSRMANDTKISIGSFVRELDLVTKELTGSVIPKDIFAAAGRPTERKFSAGQTNVGTMEQQAVGNVVLQEELSRARESSKAAQQAMRDYYNELGIDLTKTDKKTQNILNAINQSGEVHRAHVIEMQDNIDKMFDEAWDPNAWVAQSSTLNQISNILDSSVPTREEYLKNLNDINADETVVNSIREKITNNIALTEQELAVQKQVLERMLSSTESMAKLSPSFAPQARGAIAATEYLMQNPAQQAGVGVRTAAQQASARQSLSAARFRGQESFVPVTQAAQQVVDRTVIETARAAQTQSPSKRTIPIGEDIARGLSVGMMNQADDVAAAAGTVTQGAVTQMRDTGLLGPGGQPLRVPMAQPGAPIGNIAQSTALNKQTTEAVRQEIAVRKTMQQKLSSMNAALMTGTFALTSLAGAGSFAGGKLGELSQAIFKYSGLLFGLMSVTQLLTQQKILELAASRASTAGLLVGNVATKKMAFNSALFSGGIKKLIPNILNFGKVLLRFLGLTNPIGLLITGITAFWAITKAVNAAKERERQETYGLAEAMRVTAEQAKTLGDFFGVVAGRSAFESRADLRNREVVGAETRSERDRLRQDEGFQKEFKNQIEAFRKATNEEAVLAFQSLAIDLRSRGFAQEQVQTIIDALREESGQLDVKFDVKSIDFSPESIKGMEQNLNTNLEKLRKTYQTGFQKVFEYKPTGGRGGVQLVEKLVPTQELERQLANVSSYISTTAKSASTMFEGGLITGEQYTQTINVVTQQINLLDAAQRKAVLVKVFQEMGVGAEALIGNLKEAKQQMMLLALLSSGILSKDSTVLQDLAATGEDAAMRHARGVYGLTQAYDKWFGSVEKATEATNKNNNSLKDLGNGEKSPFQKALEALQGQNKELWAQAKSFGILKKAGFDAATALKYASDSTIALGIATGNIKPNQLEKLTELMEKIEKKSKSAAITEFFTKINADNKLNKSFAAVIPQISAMGGKLEDINRIMDNPDLMKWLTEGLKNGKVDAEKVKKLLDAFKQEKAIKIQVQMATPEGQREFFNEMKSKAEEYFSILEEGINDKYEDSIRKEEAAIDAINRQIETAQRNIDNYQRTIDDAQRKIELELSRPIEVLQEEINDISREIEMQFTRPIEDIQKTIDQLQRGIEIDFERPIAALQEESSDLANEMTLMDKAAEAINAKYDAQADALSKVSEINQEIIAQQKSQIGLADALTQGDISAAARAAEEMRAQSAEAASRRAGGVLDAARQAELGGLRTAGGLTREQVEARQFQIGQQVFALEEQRDAVQAKILQKQDTIYKLEQARAVKQEEIRVREDAIYQLEEKREAALLNIRITEDIIYGIQNTQIRALNDQKLVHELNLQKINDQKAAEIEKIRIQREAWTDAQLAIDMEKIKQGEFNDVIKMTNDLLGATATGIDNIISKIMSAIQAAMQLAAALAAAGSGGGGGGLGDIGPGEGIDADDSMKAANAASLAAASATKVTTAASKTATTAAKTTSTAAKTANTAAKTTVNAALNAGLNTVPKSKLPSLTPTKSSNTIPKSSMPFGGASIIKSTGSNTVPKSSMPNITVKPKSTGSNTVAKSSMPSITMPKKKAFGGFIKKMAAGGFVPGVGMTDRVPALLTPGEFVVNKNAAKSFAPFLTSLNDAKYPSMIGRGMTSPTYNVASPSSIFAMPTSNVSASVNDNSNTVYNYNVGITVGGTNSSPDSIAKAVLNEIKYIDSQRIRNQRA